MNQDLMEFLVDNLPNIIKNGANVINLDEYHDIGTHWVALYVQSTSVYNTYVNNKIVTYFDFLELNIF